MAAIYTNMAVGAVDGLMDFAANMAAVLPCSANKFACHNPKNARGNV